MSYHNQKILTSTLEIIKNNLSQKKILVVGDVMLDRYWFGEVDRISPEAPVPIAKINTVEDRLGGAANVARNIASMGGDVSLLSVVGNDEAGATLTNLLTSANIKHNLAIDNDIKTIIKLRVLARHQQLIRLDFETNPSHEILLQILNIYQNIISQFDIVILSDYGKGGLTHAVEMIKLANLQHKLILIDPKGCDYSKYRGATLITPNKHELQDVMGKWQNEEQLMSYGFALKQQLELQYLLLTRSEEGMTLFDDKKYYNYSTVAKEVFDVSGAGDTVIATLSLMLVNHINIQEAVQIANIAASIVVGKIGTATITKDELLSALNQI